MKRFIYVLLALAAFASIGSAQPRQPPLSPGIMPTGLNSSGFAVPQQGQGNVVYFPVMLPWGWGVAWDYRTYNPWTGYRYAYGGILPTNVGVTPAAPARPHRPQPVVILAEEFPATLAVQFPAAADVWLDGKKVGVIAREERVLTSPVLKPTQTYTFLVKARWNQDGKTYEAKRAVTLGPNEHSRLLIVSGDEVR
jgi:hypothetical protein